MEYQDMSAQPDMSSLGPNIFPAQPGQLPPEAYQSQTPTVRTLPPKIVKNTLPPQYKTNTLHLKLSLLDFNPYSHQLELLLKLSKLIHEKRF